MSMTQHSGGGGGFFGRALAAGVLGLAAAATSAPAQTLTTTRVAAGLALPLYVTAPRDDFARVFIVEQRSGNVGRIRILQVPANTLLATPFLSISPVATTDEEGLLGLAFHPDYMQNGYFWVYYTNSAGNNVLARYRANVPYATSNTADAASATTLITLSHPSFTNHNGGWIAFGPDGYLYIGTGDGGSSNDPNNNAQNINSLLGKMLRIDVDGADNVPGNDDDDGVIGATQPPYTNPADNPYAGPTAGLDQIYAIGLRNPWRNAFDRANGNLYIADVGQNVIEEIDMQVPGTPGLNYGWRCMEGASCTGLTGCTCNSPSLRLPIWTYTHGAGCSITGGYVYRGCAIPSLHGTYFFADYCFNTIWSFVYTGNGTTAAPTPTNRTAELAPGGGLAINTITSFGEDAFGEMYICDRGGEVFKIIPRTLGTDCNANGQADACEIAANPALDTNLNGILDSCETGACCTAAGCQQLTSAGCAAAGGSFTGLDTSCTQPGICVCPCDWNDDDGVNSQDYFDFLTAFFGNNGDFNQDGTTNSQDYFDFLTCFFELPGAC
jgi:hypothetical protein